MRVDPFFLPPELGPQNNLASPIRICLIEGPAQDWISTDQFLPSGEPQIHTKLPGKAEREGQHTQKRQHEDGEKLATPAYQGAPIHHLLALVVMPLDGKKHAGAEDENLERQEGYRDPINHFEKLQWFAPNNFINSELASMRPCVLLCQSAGTVKS
jgi:hypothetical protein